LEPVVTLHNIRMKRTKGIVRYLLAALKAIAENHRWDMRIEWDDGDYEGPISLVSVGNCPLTGGMFRMAPDADPADERLTFVRGYAPTRRRMLSLLPRTITGSYIDQHGIHQHHTRSLRIHSLQPSPLQVDGELRIEAGTDFEYDALPARLDILVPGV
jgi:diacylglycerol kinase (ATP)